MYYPLIAQFAQSLKTLDAWLDKAEAYAAARGFDVEILLNSRLAPDMLPFTYQVQSACDYVKGAAGWLAGQTPPRHPDDEKTVAELRARIAKTIAYVESIPEAQYAEADHRRVSLSWKPGKVLSGQDYLRQMSIPSIYFHLVAAYAILRHNGVDLGKMDFLGPIDWQDA